MDADRKMEHQLAEVLASFGWTDSPAFQREYLHNVFVYNLANALVVTALENKRLREQLAPVTR